MTDLAWAQTSRLSPAHRDISTRLAMKPNPEPSAAEQTHATADSQVPDGALFRSPGRSLDASALAVFESRFGHDFSHVRVHTDDQAARSARAIGALAYSVGEHIAFESGHYAPTTPAGHRLLAHELAHVVQHDQVASPSDRHDVSAPGDPAEAAAESAAEQLVHGDAIRPPGPQPSRIHRQLPTPPPPKLTQGQGRTIQPDTNIFFDIARGDAGAAKLLREICHNPEIRVQVAQSVYTELIRSDPPSSIAESEAFKLIVEKLNMKVVDAPAKKRDWIYRKFALDRKERFAEYGLPDVPGKARRFFTDLPHIANASANKAEILTRDTKTIKHAPRIGARIAQESHGRKGPEGPTSIDNILRLVPEVTAEDLASAIAKRVPAEGTPGGMPPSGGGAVEGRIPPETKGEPPSPPAENVKSAHKSASKVTAPTGGDADEQRPGAITGPETRASLPKIPQQSSLDFKGTADARTSAGESGAVLSPGAQLGEPGTLPEVGTLTESGQMAEGAILMLTQMLSSMVAETEKQKALDALAGEWKSIESTRSDAPDKGILIQALFTESLSEYHALQGPILNANYLIFERLDWISSSSRLERVFHVVSPVSGSGKVRLSFQWIPPLRAPAEPPNSNTLESISQRSGKLNTTIHKLQNRINRLLSDKHRSQPFAFDPHVLDTPRAHASSAEVAIRQDRLPDALNSVRSAERLLRNTREMLDAYENGDKFDPDENSVP